MERFRECFYRPMLSSTATFERWLKLGGARLPACLRRPSAPPLLIFRQFWL